MNLSFSGIQSDVSPIGTDAQIGSSITTRELIFLVVGDRPRRPVLAQRLRATQHPRLQAEKPSASPISGLADRPTAVSVPCMFVPRRTKFDPQRPPACLENLPERRPAGRCPMCSGWTTNSSSGGGARVPSIDYRTPKQPTLCDAGCRDVGMLDSLQQYIREHLKGTS